jgi:hypothetical protein
MKLSVFKQIIKDSIREELQEGLDRIEKKLIREIRSNKGNQVSLMEDIHEEIKPIKKSNVDNETRNRIRESFLQKMGGNPLADVLAETASTFNFNEEEEDIAPSVLDNLPNFMNKDYSQTLKAMEVSEKSRRTNM